MLPTSLLTNLSLLNLPEDIRTWTVKKFDSPQNNQYQMNMHEQGARPPEKKELA